MTPKDLIGLAADVMTLFGISGVFAWSFFKKAMEAKSAADSGITVFAYAFKTFIVFFLVLLLVIPAAYFHLFFVLFASESYGPQDGLWNTDKSFVYVLSYTVNSLWFIPAAVLLTSSVYAWSLDPFRRFFRALDSARAAKSESDRDV